MEQSEVTTADYTPTGRGVGPTKKGERGGTMPQQTAQDKMKVLVCGSRGWKDYAAIERRLSELPSGTIIIEGAAQGADCLAWNAAKKLGLSIEEFPAKWQEYGREAGIIRNAQMLRVGKPDLVLAFWDGESKGTANMIKLVQATGIPVEVIMSTGKGESP